MKSKLLVIIGSLIIASISSAQIPIQIMPKTGNQRQDQLASDLAAVANLIRAGEIPRAIAVLDHMRETYGDDPNIKALYKQAYKEGKLYKELETMIKADLAASPQNPYLLTELGEARFLQNDEAGADTLWNLAMSFGRNDENIYRFIADDKMRYGQYDSAIEIYLKGRQNLANQTLFSMELANLYETTQDYSRAVTEDLTQVLQEPAQLGFISTKIRGYLEDLKEGQDPQQIFGVITSKIKEMPNRYELYEILGDLYIKQNQMDKALECYKTISIKQNDDGQALVRFALRAYDSKAYITASNAVAEYLRLSKKATSKDMVTLIKAKSEMASGQIELAMADFRMLSSSAQDSRVKDEAGFDCGQIYAQYKNDCDSALLAWDSMQKAARDAGLQGRARLEMATCYLKKDDLASAENLVKQVMSFKLVDSTMEKASFLLGEISFYKSNFTDAEAQFKQLVDNYPQGDHTNDALLRYEVITLCTDDTVNNKYLVNFASAMKALDLGRPLDAAQILSDSAFNDSPIAEQAAFYAAMAFKGGNDKNGAVNAFKHYIEKYSSGLYIDRAYLGLGDLYLQDPATNSEAKAAFDKILEAFPDGPVTEIARQRLLQLTSPGKNG